MEFIVYDKLDRPVASGPANSPFSDISTTGWIITKYDVFGRVVYTGWNNTPSTAAARKALQDAQNTASVISETKQSSGTIDGITVYYSNTAAPTVFKLLTVNYYDNYTLPPSSPAITIPATVEGQNTLTSSQVKKLTTASWTRIPTLSSAVLGETNVIFYDTKARPIRTYSQNYLGGYTYTDSKLDEFSGQLQYTITKHKRLAGSTELKTKEAFTYSPQDRLLTHTHQINDGTIELMASNTYNELGQLITKNVGNTVAAPIQKIDYSYNIRGWMTDINDINVLAKSGGVPKDLFAFKINYNTPASGITDVKPLYNGNISETYWSTNSDNGTIRTYGYRYDNLNRLKDAVYKKGSVVNSYNESLSYDKNGNIMNLTRYGSIDDNAQTLIDNLTYTYKDSSNSNQLMKVADAVANNPNFKNEFKDSASNTADDYDYDADGNMIKDNNKNITAITYNQLNLPTKITFALTGNIAYIYNAAGQKVQKIVTEGANITTTDYLGGYQYVNAVLKFFPTAEGYVEPSGSSYKYIYQYKDHLGNVRLSYDKNLVIQEENNYYPFGLKQFGYNGVAPSSNDGLKYKYNGKELQDELGLNMYDYGARNYDPAIGRWMNIDPLAEHTQNMTPYHYCSNNPINRNDPNGMCDDPNCPHGAIRRGWDAVGRFFGAWGHSDSSSAIAQNSSNVSVGPIQEVASQATSSTNTVTNQVDLIPDNLLAKLDYSTSTTVGDAKIFNSNSKTTNNLSTGSVDSSVDNQLNLYIANFNFETASSSISFGGEVSAFGRLGLGVSVSLNSDVISSNISINGNGNLNGDNTSSTISAGIKPVGIVVATLATIIERFVPTPLIPYGAQMSTLPIAGQTPTFEN
ncbi:RHS repeat-associated core domain-containing protein [Flavobacterium sp. MC2016-06]|jgi:RHS repeat-associated protein|uniref:RHS repeat domain-containing protein n=1 Tax=Flavobacterium sp. MC2016-06 TaxID=2676308 RepID=UPI00209A7959|nr:RHS repeat-associated core domain-containing protein [Flavobacterium sp. MC2016-06]